MALTNLLQMRYLMPSGKCLCLLFFLLPLLYSCTNGNNGNSAESRSGTKQQSDSILLLLKKGDSAVMRKGEFRPDLEYGIAQATQSEQISHRIHYKKGVGKAMLLKAKAYLEMKDVARGMDCCRKAMDIFKEWGTADDQAECLLLTGNSIGNSHKEFPEKIAYYEKAAAIYKAGGNRLKEAETKQLIADLYGNDEQFDRSLERMLEAMDIYRAIGYKRLQEAYTLLGSIYMELNNPLEGRRNLLLAVKTAEELHDTTAFMATVYNRLGFSYWRIDDFKSAENYFEKSYAIAKHAQDTAAVTEIINNIADALAKQGRYQESNEFLKKALEAYPLTNDEERVAITAFIFTGNYLALKDMKNAQVYYDQLLKVYRNQEENDPDYQFIKTALISYLQAAGRYAETYPYLESYKKGIGYGKNFKRTARLELLYAISDSAMGRYPSAMNHQRLHKAFSDSQMVVDKGKQMEELLLQYETEKKDKNILLLESRQKDQETRLKEEQNLRYLVIGSSAVLLLFLVLLYNRYRLKQRSNQQLQQQQQEINQQNELLKKLVADKEWLLKEIHHRVKNNLQISISLLNTQSRHLENEDAIAAIRNSQRRMYAMSLIYQRLYQNDNLGNIDMDWYISELMDFLKDSFEIRDDIKFTLDCDPVSLDVVQAIPLGLILNEAITNAIKYAFADGRKGHIRVGFTIEDEVYCLLSISDNGAGIAADKAGGNSLGMNLMQGLAEQVDGEFHLSSSPAGVTVTIRLPYRQLPNI